MSKRFWKCISYLSAILAVLCILIVIKQYADSSYVLEVLESIPTDNTETVLSTESTEPIINFSTRTIDFETLKIQNPDVYAWIEVPGTKIDYPILQHETDNTYYLTHTIDHEKTVAASIYTENYNAKDFNDLHTVIYGHNMKNQTMFRTLHNFESYDFFNENRDIIIFLPEETRYYKVFAAYTYDNRHLLFSFDWSTPETFQNYIDEIMAIDNDAAFIDNEMHVTGKDNIITLSTCVNSGDATKRYLVQAVLVSIK